MKGHEAAAARLQRLYAEELQQLLRPEALASMDETPAMHERQARALIRHARERSPAVYEGPDETTWIWSDLHLGDMGTIMAFDRPFEKPYEMDHVLIEAWCEAAEADDTTILPGRRERRRLPAGTPPGVLGTGARCQVAGARKPRTSTRSMRNGR